MTESLQELDRRIRSVAELHSITRTMRGLAAVSLRHDELAAQATHVYEAIIEDGLHVALREGGLERLTLERPGPDAPTALIVFGSNQGLCGAINRHVAAHASAELATAERVVKVGAVGARLRAELDLAGLATHAHWELPSTTETITPRAAQLLLRADRWRTDDGVERILLVFPWYRSRTQGYEPVTLQLAPTDPDRLQRLATRPWPSRILPTYRQPWDGLVGELIRQAMFVRLHRTFAQTMASVSASRLAAMDAAQRDIEERLTALRLRHQQLRQAEITEELLDVVSGFEVLQQS